MTGTRVRACVAERARSSAGETLVEGLVSMGILGLAVAATVGGLATSISMSTGHREQATTSVLALSASEAVKTQAYVPCQTVTTSSYNPTLQVTVPAGWPAGSVTVTSVLHWDAPQAAFVSGACSQDKGLELVTVRVVAPDNKSTTTLDVVKRQSS